MRPHNRRGVRYVARDDARGGGRYADAPVPGQFDERRVEVGFDWFKNQRLLYCRWCLSMGGPMLLLSACAGVSNGISTNFSFQRI